MATAMVVLDRLWLMDPTDPTHPIVAGSSGGLGGGTRANTSDFDGEFRKYVGRVRMIGRTVTTQTHSLALRQLDDATARKLEGWKGRLLLLRDIYGRRVWGGILSTQRQDYLYLTTGLCDVAFVFQQITYADSV